MASFTLEFPSLRITHFRALAGLLDHSVGLRDRVPFGLGQFRSVLPFMLGPLVTALFGGDAGSGVGLPTALPLRG